MLLKKNPVLIVLAVIFIITVVAAGSLIYSKQKINPQIQPTNAAGMKPGTLQSKQKISVKKINSKYKTVSSKPSGDLSTGQEADMMLSGIDFNNSGGALLFNHQGNIATDGERLILADRNNNRVLIWNKLPAKNVSPDLVLGQKNFTENSPGLGLDKMNWPIGVAISNGKLLIADSYNDRILVWNSMPTKNGQPADFELKESVGWPWAVWTDGTKVIVASTGKAQVVIWNSFPNVDKKPDITIHLPGELGTPRSIGSNGTNLVIGDHNAFGTKQGTFFWKKFPLYDNQKYDFFLDMQNTVLWGPAFTSNGKLVGVSNQLHIWNSFPKDKNDLPDLSIGASHPGDKGYDFGGTQSGDGSGVAIAGNKVYVSLSNGNKIVGFNSFPKNKLQNPDFAIGAPNINGNTLETNYFMTNPVPASDGKSLFVISAFDRTLSVWNSLPDESGAKPNFVYKFDFAPNDIIVFKNYLILGGNNKLAIWKKLPLNGELPDATFDGKMGDFGIGDVQGIALDDKYFYLSDRKTNKIHVWEGVPLKGGPPKFSFGEAAPKLSSDGKYLVAIDRIYKINGLSSSSVATEIPGRIFNLPGDGMVYNGKYFVANTVHNRVHVWNSIDDALNGGSADVILGQPDRNNITPAIGKNRLFWPGALYFDGSYLWVGEYKFSGRVLRFSVRERGEE